LGKAVRGVEFFVFSLVNVTQGKAYPVLVKQTVRSEGGRSGKRKSQEKEEEVKDGRKSEKEVVGQTGRSQKQGQKTVGII
jgi:hypothetical protein